MFLLTLVRGETFDRHPMWHSQSQEVTQAMREQQIYRRALGDAVVNAVLTPRRTQLAHIILALRSFADYVASTNVTYESESATVMLPALVDLVARNSLRLREVILYGELMVGEEGSGISPV